LKLRTFCAAPARGKSKRNRSKKLFIRLLILLHTLEAEPIVH
jgi:hypothetical protein